MDNGTKRDVVEEQDVAIAKLGLLKHMSKCVGCNIGNNGKKL